MRSKMLVSLIAVPALALAACTSAGSTGAGGDEGDLVDGKTFTMAIGLDPGALDPG